MYLLTILVLDVRFEYQYTLFNAPPLLPLSLSSRPTSKGIVTQRPFEEYSNGEDNRVSPVPLALYWRKEKKSGVISIIQILGILEERRYAERKPASEVGRKNIKRYEGRGMINQRCN